MNITGIFHPIGLLIWIPGLLFMVGVLLILVRSPQGRATRGMYLATLAMFIIGVASIFIVPMMQIDDALTYANAYEPDNPVDRYGDISYDAKAAYFRTALPPEERGAQQTLDDIFSFSEPAAQTNEIVRDTASMDAIEYKPEYSSAWLFLVFFMIPGILAVVQDPKGFLRAWNRQSS